MNKWTKHNDDDRRCVEINKSSENEKNRETQAEQQQLKMLVIKKSKND